MIVFRQHVFFFLFSSLFLLLQRISGPHSPTTFFFTTLQLKYTVTPRPLLFILVYCFLTIYNTAQHRLTIQFNQLILAIHRFDFFLGGKVLLFSLSTLAIVFFLLFTFRVVMGSVAWWLSGPLPGGSSLHFTFNSCLYPFFNSIWGLVGRLIRGK